MLPEKFNQYMIEKKNCIDKTDPILPTVSTSFKKVELFCGEAKIGIKVDQQNERALW